MSGTAAANGLRRRRGSRGAIGWMVRNRVTPNLLMLFLIVGGLFMSGQIEKEVFPEFTLDIVSVSVVYPGASPEEVEQGIVLAVEEAVRGLDGVEEITATAGEGFGRVAIEIMENADDLAVYQEIKQEIDRITTFPEDAEEPQVALISRQREVLQLQIYGDVDEWTLRNLAEEVRDRLLLDPEITQVELIGARNYEIAIEVPEAALRAHGLTLEGVARHIAATALELPGGGVDTAGGEILVRFKERRDWAREFAVLPVITTAAGTVLTLGDIAVVREGFEDTDREATYNGRPSIGLGVYRIGTQTPVGVSEAARRAMAEIAADLPPGVDYAVNRDRSDIYRQRLQLLLKNAFMGLVLVLCLLGVFLEFKLAFWVTMGIPVSFLGSLLFLPGLDVTLNVISMFAFIVALGIVVDDAIIAGENIYEYRQQGMDNLDAAVRGARDVAWPIAFSIITNIVAFLPLCFIPGVIGKIWKVIPFVVITVFIISWIESLLILPAHLAHTRSRPRSRLAAALHHRQQAFSARFSRFVERAYGPFLAACIRRRYLTLAIGLFILVTVLGLVAGKHIGIILMPRVESDYAVVTATLPYGSPLSRVREVRDRLVRTATAISAENGGDRLVQGIFAVIDENVVEVTTYLTDPDVRPLRTAQVARRWRERNGTVAGLESLVFEADRGGPGSGAALTVELSHRDIGTLDRTGAALAEILGEFAEVKDIDDGYTPGKRQLDFRLTPAGRSLGLTTREVARQVRAAFYGAEALRQQRGRNEVKVMVRLPEAERLSEFDIERLLIRTPAGRDVPLLDVAAVSRGRSYTAIDRRNGRRTVTVTANVEPIGATTRVRETLDATVLPQLGRDYPGLSWGYEGRQARFAESFQGLYNGLLMALLGIFFLLAVSFRSYVQPVIVMISIPFGIVGAVLGHLLMGYNLSVMSMMGIIALAGVVVNDSLVLIDYTNRRRGEGIAAHEAVVTAGIRRFRPILLTTLTTFGGLAPMIFETSRQARFMIPMALSLGFGILFATGISLILVPCLYLIVEDVTRPFGGGE
ncbi:MAG: efflux RND transporter permease subunit [Deltaproteobacteria bacterium]|nr:efflux RND transporter permease subunit [Candidatus Anaeroferrophillacea bacterium]